MTELIQLMLAPFAACMVLVGLFAYLGIHVIAREVIFVDLSLAQMAALGSTSALLFGVSPDSALGYGFSLAFTTLGALIFSLTRTSRMKRRVPHEAIIGIVFVVASAAAILVADRTAIGHEVIEEILVGGILWISWNGVLELLVVFVAVGVFHWFLRHRFLAISLKEDFAERQGWHIRLWDFLFYASFGVAITVAVPVAGVLLVFTFLVVPAVIAFLFSRRPALLVAISWCVAAVACAAGIALSYQFDLPTGPLIVCVFGLALLGAGLVSQLTPPPVAETTAAWETRLAAHAEHGKEPPT
jgi:zinc/manganese transport system permease protein